MGTNTVNVERYAVAVAAETVRKPNGDLNGHRLKELAKNAGMSESTLRRIMEKHNLPRENRHPLTHLVRNIEGLPNYLQSPEKVLLLALAMNAGILKLAHKFATDVCGFPFSYRTFIRRVDDLDPAVRAGVMHGHKAAIESMLFVTNPSPHRNHRWHIDSTEADVRVLPARGSTPFRPWITVVVDRATNMYMSILVSQGRPNSSTTQLALAMAAVGNQCEGDDFIGGLPTVLVFDNGSENVNNAVTEACARLGIVCAPTAPRHPWQNGSVERSHKNIQQNFLASYPGSMVGGKTPGAQYRFTPDFGVEAEPGTFEVDGMTLVSLAMFTRDMEAFRVEHNNTPNSKGFSPVDRWHNDNTALLRMDPYLMLANMARSSAKRTVHKAGIRFNEVDYISNAIKGRVKEQLDVRYFPNVTDWIEVFDGEKYIGRAYSPNALSEVERNKITIGRFRDLKTIRINDENARRMKNHMAHAINEGHDPESFPEIEWITPDTTKSPNTQKELPRLNKKSKTRKDESKKPSNMVGALADEFEDSDAV